MAGRRLRVSRPSVNDANMLTFANLHYRKVKVMLMGMSVVSSILKNLSLNLVTVLFL